MHVIGFNAQLGESFKSHYIYGEQLSYDGLTLTADWSDGTTKPVALKNCTYTTQVNMNRTADVTLHIACNKAFGRNTHYPCDPMKKREKVPFAKQIGTTTCFVRRGRTSPLTVELLPGSPAIP